MTRVRLWWWGRVLIAAGRLVKAVDVLCLSPARRLQGWALDRYGEALCDRERGRR